ncbi:MAG: flagellar assembly protein FliX [Bdellovibrionales bacterium]
MINKIDGPGPIRTPQQIKRAAKAAGTGGPSFARQLDESSESGATQSMSATAHVSGVLGVQEIDDALAQASRGKKRAFDILDRLEDLRIEILTGTISRDKLLQLTQVVSSRRAQISDPRLAEVLDEIDLRAQVELAKYEVRGKPA